MVVFIIQRTFYARIIPEQVLLVGETDLINPFTAMVSLENDR